MQSNSDNTVPKVKEETDFADTSSQSYLDNAFQKSADVLDVEDEEQLIDDESDQSSDSENASNQLVVYNATSDTDQHEPVSEPVGYQPPSFPSDLTPDPPPRVLPSIGAFTVQCAICFKWRLIPTKEKYEEIREKILQQPFACEAAREWRPDISCDDPTDLSQDGSRLWAIDKPNIAQPPPGWQRLLRIRGEGSTKFADIYYAAPSGKKLRSMVEIQKYLAEHPEYNEGVNMERFSFQIPKPLQENYVRKRPARVPSSCDSTGQGISSPLEPREVNPLNWARPADNELLIGSGSLLNSCVDDSVLEPVTPPEKKRAKKSSKNLYSNTLYNRPEIQSERSSL